VSDGTYKLDELAKAAGTSARTVRYYVQRGLLPPPVFKGKDSAYAEDHLVRLAAIKKLQGDYLPLDAIAAELEGRSIEEIEAIAKSSPRPLPSHDVHPQKIVVAAPLVRAHSWRRHEIARGLEMNVADDASGETKALAEKILKLISGLQEGE
jgi:Ca-activated chloride channel family protein